MKAPVLFLIFNRLDTTEKVFKAIREAKPTHLYIAADGPRLNKAGEYEKCEETRKFVVSGIDWDCEVKTLFRNENLGCRNAVSSGITWFFDQVEYGIILEDDCVPQASFFTFCDTMLKYYNENESIYGIGGTNLQDGIQRGDGSYYFSKYAGIWGWASWSRAWKKYDINMSSLEEFEKENKIQKIFKDKKEQNFWLNLLKKVPNYNTWDYQWLYTIWNHEGIYIIPNSNLINNIGFDAGGTHTMDVPSWYNKLSANREEIKEIVHPSSISISEDADRFLFNEAFQGKSSIMKRGTSFIKRVIKRVIKGDL